jgi:hypothetical protein
LGKAKAFDGSDNGDFTKKQFSSLENHLNLTNNGETVQVSDSSYSYAEN